MENKQTLVIPTSWTGHAKEVDALLQQIEQQIVLCKAKLYDLTQQRDKLHQHLQVTLPPLAASLGKNVDSEKPIEWSTDRKMLTVFVKED